jgi:hypothetical protein
MEGAEHGTLSDRCCQRRVCECVIIPDNHPAQRALSVRGSGGRLFAVDLRDANAASAPHPFSVSSTRSGVNGRWRSRLPVSW